ncbi:DEAD/DEAH box helicase [Lentilactobacillus kisonensis]|nr:DEAD/DEAH box helicase [Lentilactobacillus kisonensis]
MPMFNVPRIISLFDETNEFLALPRGLEEEITGLIPHINWIDKTVTGQPIHAKFNGTLRSEQQSALQELLDHQIGVLAARTGFGKTVIAAALISKIGVSTLILVHDKGLAKQWIERLNQFLEIKDNPFIKELTPTGRQRHKNVIGRYFGTTHNRSGIIDVATIQSFKDDAASKEILDQYGLVISDEVHHDAAFTFEQIVKKLSCKYLYGLSATPYRRDGQDPIISMRFGPIRYQTAPIDEKTLNQVNRVVIPRFTSLGVTSLEIANNDINRNYEAIINDPTRNQSIIQDITDNLSQGRHVLVLTRRVEHVHRLAEILNNQQSVFLLYGEQKDRENTRAIDQVNKLDGPYVLIATGKYAGEGLDIASIDTLILAMPHSWKGNSVQYLGRAQRDLSKKSEIRVYDYIDMFVPMLAKMYRKRQKTYKELHYTITDDAHSQQSGIKFFDGHYQQNILKSLASAQQLRIITNKLEPFLQTEVLKDVPQDTKINILTNKVTAEEKQQFNRKSITYSLYDRNLPNCLIVNNQQMWLSSDLGFSRNSGITIRINQPELIKQFVGMLMNTIDHLSES